jgi:hypothetical protein
MRLFFNHLKKSQLITCSGTSIFSKDLKGISSTGQYKKMRGKYPSLSLVFTDG